MSGEIQQQPVDGAMCMYCRRVLRIREQGYVEPSWNQGKGTKACSWIFDGSSWRRSCE